MSSPTLGARLRSMRKAAGFTQVGLGKKLGVTNSHIHRVEAGHGGISVDLALRWVKLCGGSVYVVHGSSMAELEAALASHEAA